MATIKQRITNCLWYDSEAEQAVDFYTSIFENSRTGLITRFGKAGYEFHKKQEGSIMTITFYLDGQEFMALNGGPDFKFNEAISLIINCETQEEIDHFWNSLSAGGKEGPCGWLTDKFGVSWQIVPCRWSEMISNPDKNKVNQLLEAMFKMAKPDIQIFERILHG